MAVKKKEWNWDLVSSKNISSGILERAKKKDHDVQTLGTVIVSIASIARGDILWLTCLSLFPLWHVLSYSLPIYHDIFNWSTNGSHSSNNNMLKREEWYVTGEEVTALLIDF